MADIIDKCCIRRVPADLQCDVDLKLVMFILKIRKYLTRETTEMIVHALVASKLDYCNSLLYGLPKFLIAKLQSVQNSAARLVCMTRKFDHITRL